MHVYVKVRSWSLSVRVVVFLPITTPLRLLLLGEFISRSTVDTLVRSFLPCFSLAFSARLAYCSKVSFCADVAAREVVPACECRSWGWSRRLPEVLVVSAERLRRIIYHVSPSCRSLSRTKTSQAVLIVEIATCVVDASSFCIEKTSVTSLRSTWTQHSSMAGTPGSLEHKTRASHSSFFLSFYIPPQPSKFAPFFLDTLH